MKAELTNIRNLIHVELCPDCILRAGHDVDPDYVINKGKAIIVTSKSELDKVRQTVAPITGFPDEKTVEKAFNDCKHTEIDEGEVVCAAITALNRVRYGREEI